MHIIFGEEIGQAAAEKHIVLELDTFEIKGKESPMTAYALVEHVPLQDMPTMNHFHDLHTNLMVEYRKRNWKYCEDAMEHLQGKWNGDLDTFYTELSARIQRLKTESLPNTWSGTVLKS
jgi:hypothetical protein